MFEGLTEITHYLRSQFGDSLVLVIKASDSGLHINAITYIEKEGKPIQIGVETVFQHQRSFPNPRLWAEDIAVKIDNEIIKALAPGAVR